MIKLRAFAVALALVASVATTPAAAAPRQVTGEGAGADVRIEGNKLVIVLHMTVLIRSGLLDSSVQQDLQDGLDSAAAYWNAGLAEHPYFDDCFSIEVEVDATFVHPVNRDFDSQDHVVQTYGSSHVGTMADGRQLPSAFDSSGPADPTLDYEGPFEHPIQAYWPPWLFQDTAGLAHEMGHLFGLGDDYARGDDGTTASLDGRDGTLMDTGDAIDSVLAQRVGDQIVGGGYVDQFPQCWKGSGTFSTTAVYPDADATTCRDGWTMNYTFVVAPDGSIDGSGVANQTTPGRCPFPFGPQIDFVGFDVQGQRAQDALTVSFTIKDYGPSGAGMIAGFYAPFFSGAAPGTGAPVTLPIVGAAASAPGEWSFGSGNPPATYTTSGSLDAQCTVSCE